MKTFNEFCSQLDESSLSRIKSKSDKGGMAVISGSRGDKSKKENKARAKQLDQPPNTGVKVFIRTPDVKSKSNKTYRDVINNYSWGQGPA